ncbi:LURP-one-related family protein [Halpernia frigidisoli]|uniref:Scramblase n=1 Tax=Halpernia frigidisoli TaxID=1125876 RepID=A0A1I3DGD0_9FLAO|nr:LURP-one-related family protein [Halpernia frigidisoli]SFH85551.1 hypothetical protein SAMN05443292_0436 [Halpernia frigidisoli]
MQNLNYPLDLKFKITTLANDFTMTDSNGQNLAYVRSKIFKLKDDVQVFKDESKTEILYTIKANQWLDFNASFSITENNGDILGSVSRKGIKSFWRATYNVLDIQKNIIYTITEENPWIKFFDGLIGEIPLIGLFTGYFLNPTYLVKDKNNTILLRLKKMPSLIGRRFQISKTSEINEKDESLILLSLIMSILLERHKG